MALLHTGSAMVYRRHCCTQGVPWCTDGTAAHRKCRGVQTALLHTGSAVVHRRHCCTQGVPWRTYDTAAYRECRGVQTALLHTGSAVVCCQHPRPLHIGGTVRHILKWIRTSSNFCYALISKKLQKLAFGEYKGVKLWCTKNKAKKSYLKATNLTGTNFSGLNRLVFGGH